VVGRWEGGGTHTGPACSDLPGGSLPPATGKKIPFAGTTVYRVVNGKSAEELGQEHALTALQQLGLVPAALHWWGLRQHSARTEIDSRQHSARARRFHRLGAGHERSTRVGTASEARGHRLRRCRGRGAPSAAPLNADRQAPRTTKNSDAKIGELHEAALPIVRDCPVRAHRVPVGRPEGLPFGTSGLKEPWSDWSPMPARTVRSLPRWRT
jgi:hypothetical protein